MQRAKSIAEHKLHGTTPGAKNPAQASGIPAGRPKFPKNLPVELRFLFKQTCKLLQTRRALTEADGPILGIYCVAYQRAQRAHAKLNEQGEVCSYTRLDSHGKAHQQEKANLWLKVAQDAEKLMVACIDRLGLSPLNRDKVKPTGGGQEEVVDPLDAFLARGHATRPVIAFDKEKARDEHVARTSAKESASDDAEKV
jgi:P27 family predicted phage terminase small subunit